jgi:DNA polymerase III delta prime subunit
MANTARLVVKYRPRLLSDFNLAPGMREIVNQLLVSDCLRVLVVGGAGAGKTSLLRVLEEEYYGGTAPEGAILRLEAHGDQCLAQQRAGIKTFCQTPPPIAWGRRRLVVIDDAELVPQQVQQAVRGCIDSYSHHAHFIAACTQVQKVVPALQSRLVVVQTAALDANALAALQSRVCWSEGLELGPGAAAFVLSASGTSTRAVLQHLEKLALCPGRVDLAAAQQCCSTIHPDTLASFTEKCMSGDGGYAAARLLYTLYDDGFSVMDILDTYFSYLKTASMPDTLRYAVIRLLSLSMLSFYKVHENEITLAVLAREMALLLSPSSGNE